MRHRRRLRSAGHSDSTEGQGGARHAALDRKLVHRLRIDRAAPVLALEQLPPPSGLTVAGSSSGGSFAAGTYYWQVTATNANGETIGSSEVSATLSGTASSVALSWTRVAGATGYNVYRGTSAASENTLVASIPYGSTVTHTDTGSAGVPTKPRSVNTADLSSVDTLSPTPRPSWTCCG